jgi:hypothetical protein
MNRIALLVCVLLALFASVCHADGVNGVLSEDRVITLPQDQGKWYVSIVGSAVDNNYQQVVGWFNSDAKMTKLRNTVHFNAVTTDTAIYRERYATTTGQFKITALPCVRLQRPDGVVVYQACGNDIPMTSQGLYGALANSIQVAEGRPILPWRQRMENAVFPCPKPQPQPEPNPDPEPQPIEPQPPLDPPDAPVVDTDLPAAWLIVLALALGSALGAAYQWKKTRRGK